MTEFKRVEDDLEDDSAEYPLPSYSDKGYIEVEVIENEPNSVYNWFYEVEDADLGSSVYWIQEGMGFDYWLDSYIEFPGPGRYRIEGIHGEYVRGEWGYTDDDEGWYFDSVISLEG